jgi:hypothetical protein
VPLRKDVKSPLAARNDAENPRSTPARRRQADDKKTTKRRQGRREAAAAGTSTIDSIASRQRSVVLPPKSGATPICRR